MNANTPTDLNDAPSTSSSSTVGANRNLPNENGNGNAEQSHEDGAQIPAVASQRKLKRKLNDESSTSSSNGNGNGEMNNLLIFPGRDESYPDELNKLILPLSCQLCKAQMTSIKSAKDHYESKAHDRHISAWLAKNYTEVGLQTPPIKRLIKQGPTGPNAFHCDLCDLALTSATHARQHYNGRKHLLVQQKGFKPSGAGYYNAAGKWVRTGTKVEPTVADDGRFGIGELFIKTPTYTNKPMAIEVLGSNGQQSEPVATSSSRAGTSLIDDSLSCKICGISVTSASQIKMHLDGIKHQKNLLKNNMQEDDTNFNSNSNANSNSIPNPTGDALNMDVVMYRTPSGSYYCKLCNKAMNHISILQQHLQGKKHQKTLREQSDTRSTTLHQ